MNTILDVRYTDAIFLSTHSLCSREGTGWKSLLERFTSREREGWLRLLDMGLLKKSYLAIHWVLLYFCPVDCTHWHDVLSVVIVGQPKNAPPPELKLTLASLQGMWRLASCSWGNVLMVVAPRLALKPTTMSSTNLTTKGTLVSSFGLDWAWAVDQDPFAWDSREFLRKLCIGKKVFFKVIVFRYGASLTALY